MEDEWLFQGQTEFDILPSKGRTCCWLKRQLSRRIAMRLPFPMMVLCVSTLVCLAPESACGDFLILTNGQTFQGKVLKNPDGSYHTKETKYAYSPKRVARVSKEKTVEEVLRNWGAEVLRENTLEGLERALSLAKFCIIHGKYPEAYRFCRCWAAPRGWKVGTSKYFFILSDAKKKRIEEIKVRLDAIMNRFIKDFKSKDKLKRDFIVRMFEKEDDYKAYARSQGSDGSAYYDADARELVLEDASEVDKNFTFEAVFHEANHQFVDEYYFKHSTKHMWFSEGWATYYESVKFKRGRIVDVGKKSRYYLTQLKEDLRNNNSAPFKSFLKITPKLWSISTTSQRDYAQAWSMLYFFQKTKKKEWKDRFKQYMEVLRKTKDDDKALSEAFPPSKVAELEADWKAFVGKLR
jgi:hypothetical protein